jgi:hypothetical protein
MADMPGRHARRGSAVSPFRRGLASGCAREQCKNFPEDLLAGNRLRKRLVRHDLAAAAAVILVPADITGRCQIVHDAVGASLGDVQAGRHGIQSHPRVVREKQQHTAVVTHDAQLPMPKTLSRFLEKNCGHCVAGLRIQGSSAAARPGQKAHRMAHPRSGHQNRAVTGGCCVRRQRGGASRRQPLRITGHRHVSAAARSPAPDERCARSVPPLCTGIGCGGPKAVTTDGRSFWPCRRVGRAVRVRRASWLGYRSTSLHPRTGGFR